MNEGRAAQPGRLRTYLPGGRAGQARRIRSTCSARAVLAAVVSLAAAARVARRSAARSAVPAVAVPAARAFTVSSTAKQDTGA